MVMKRLFLTGIAALFLATGTAHAQDLWTFRPSPEYDHPFDGLVMVQRASKEYIRKRCPSENSMACAIKFYSKTGTVVACLLILPSDDFLSTLGRELKELYRHEIAHCNGWPGHHDGKTWKLKSKTVEPTQVSPVTPENRVDVIEEGCG